MNFELNLHKIAIKVQNVNRAKSKKNHFWTKKQLGTKSPQETLWIKYHLKKLIKVFAANSTKRVIFVLCYQWKKLHPHNHFLSFVAREGGIIKFSSHEYVQLGSFDKFFLRYAQDGSFSLLSDFLQDS